jgi:AcrR family transcriptional regulator
MDRRERLLVFYERHFKKRPQQSRSRSVVEAILSAALEGLARGAEEVSVADVATRAGVGIGSLYDYFRDRKDLFAGAVAKVTEDNLAAFEALLRDLDDASLREGTGRIVDFALETYAKDNRVPRSVLRLAHALNLMPMLAESQGLFAVSLGDYLARRRDVRVADVQVAAYVVTQSVMGLINVLVWETTPRMSRTELREACVDMIVAYLSGSRASPDATDRS